MEQITPSPGRIVEYTLTDSDAAAINRRRHDARRSGLTAQGSGAVVHFGNDVAAGETYPMIIVRAWGTTPEATVNGQVLLDGNDTYWVTSAKQGEGHREWRTFARTTPHHPALVD